VRNLAYDKVRSRLWRLWKSPVGGRMGDRCPGRPMAALVSTDDRVAPPADADVILAAIGATDRGRLTLSRLSHAAAFDFGRDAVSQAARVFSRQRIGW